MKHSYANYIFALSLLLCANANMMQASENRNTHQPNHIAEDAGADRLNLRGNTALAKAAEHEQIRRQRLEEKLKQKNAQKSACLNRALARKHKNNGELY